MARVQGEELVYSAVCGVCFGSLFKHLIINCKAEKMMGGVFIFSPVPLKKFLFKIWMDGSLAKELFLNMFSSTRQQDSISF